MLLVGCTLECLNDKTIEQKQRTHANFEPPLFNDHGYTSKASVRCVPGWKVCQLRTECQETDNILRTKNEINVRTKIKIEIARDGPIPIFYDSVL